MKALRVIKVIFFVVAILSLLLAGASHFFIINDMLKNDSLTMAEIKTALADYDFKLSSLSNPFGKASAEEADNVVPETETETVVEPAEPTVPEEPAEEVSAYKVEDHANAVIGVMKYGSAEIELKFLNNLFKLNEVYVVNWCLIVFYGSMFIAFIMHIISKKCRKTFYGILMNIIGFIFFTGSIFVGIFVAAAWSNLFQGFENIDSTLLSFGFVTCGIIHAFLLGLPVYRIGSRSMQTRALKRENRKLRSKKHAMA